MKILSIIPARGGSKSIPRKNLIVVNGKPLIEWTIEASLNSKFITKTIVSSDDTEILSNSIKYGADIIKRPKIYSLDNTTVVPVIKHSLRQLTKKGDTYDVLILLQPTSPLRTSEDIDDAIKMFISKKATALVSGYEPAKSPLKSFKLNEKGYLRGLVNNSSPLMDRQSLPQTFYPNGAIYIFYVKEFMSTNNIFTAKTIPYFMPLEKSIDIDTIKDVEMVNSLMKSSNAKM